MAPPQFAEPSQQNTSAALGPPAVGDNRDIAAAKVATTGGAAAALTTKTGENDDGHYGQRAPRNLGYQSIRAAAKLGRRNWATLHGVRGGCRRFRPCVASLTGTQAQWRHLHWTSLSGFCCGALFRVHRKQRNPDAATTPGVIHETRRILNGRPIVTDRTNAEQQRAVTSGRYRPTIQLQRQSMRLRPHPADVFEAPSSGSMAAAAAPGPAAPA
jgi:hypothetical protein